MRRQTAQRALLADYFPIPFTEHRRNAGQDQISNVDSVSRQELASSEASAILLKEALEAFLRGPFHHSLTTQLPSPTSSGPSNVDFQ